MAINHSLLCVSSPYLLFFSQTWPWPDSEELPIETFQQTVPPEPAVDHNKGRVHAGNLACVRSARGDGGVVWALKIEDRGEGAQTNCLNAGSIFGLRRRRQLSKERADGSPESKACLWVWICEAPTGYGTEKQVAYRPDPYKTDPKVGILRCTKRNEMWEWKFEGQKFLILAENGKVLTLCSKLVEWRWIICFIWPF